MSLRRCHHTAGVNTADFVVIGGGVVGLTVASALRRRFPDQSVVVLEKERELAAHASGRNSGVLHAGFYYTADSLKARFTKEGNRRLTDYCLDRGLSINRCGKLVVTKNEEELAALAELKRRGDVNGIDLREVSEEEARDIEPRCRTVGRALVSPTTSAVDPVAVMAALREDAEALGVAIHTGVRARGWLGGALRTAGDKLQAGYVVNAAGLQADAVARWFGFGEGLRILPFKGLYLYGDEPAGAFRVHLYPVPDMRNPFLGVHTTLTVDGRVKIGPTATPCFWREQYGALENFRADELADISLLQLSLLLHSDFDFKHLAVEELRKMDRRHLVAQASHLATGITPENYRRWGRPGIRAQLYDTKKKALVMDFVVQGDGRSMHVLNAVSPAFTCALPFADHVVDRIAEAAKTIA